jgi:hypothetical protein
MPKSITSSRPSKTRSLWGKAAPKGVVLATKAATLVALLVIYYVIVFFAAIQVVPLIMGFVKSGTGVTLDMPLETVLSAWIVPALFLVALFFALVLVTIRALWRFRARVIRSVTHWVFNEDNRIEAAPAGISTKNAQKQKNTSEKAA